MYVGDSVLHDAPGAARGRVITVWLDRHHDGWAAPDGVLRITSLAELPDVLSALT